RQEVPHTPPLLTARLHHRPDTRQVFRTLHALWSVAHLPPQYPMTQGTLRCVVGRLDTIDEREQKHRHLPTQQFAACSRRFSTGAPRPPLQDGAEAHTKLPLSVQPACEAYLRQRPITHSLPPAQHLTRHRQQLLTNRRSRVVPIHHCLKISTQMRPTPLVP